MTSLSLLSRGNGQVLQHSQRLEVHFEPEDYFNWKTREGLLHLNDGLGVEQSCWSHPPHKTYSTRKGALVLYAEDLALPSWKLAGGKKARQGRRHRTKRFEIELRTLRDLAGAILSYGSRQKRLNEARWQPYLHFLSEQDNKIDRQMHPGYSAKRYLSCLSQTWDPSTLHRLECAGCIRDSALLHSSQTNVAAPTRRLQDLSAAPTQYRILPVYTSFYNLPKAEPRQRRTSGHCSPVPEEREYEDDPQEGWEVHEEYSRKGGTELAPTRATKRKLGSEWMSQHERESMWAEHDSHVGFPEVTQMEYHQSEEHSPKEDQEPAEIPSKTGGHSFGSISLDASLFQSGKSHTTFYGGPFSGRKKSHNVKQGHMKLQDDREEHVIQELPADGGFLPPIPSTLGPDHGATREVNTKQVHETLKLPPISEESLRAQPQRKIRNRASDPPKELLVLPLLVHFQTHQRAKEETKDEGEGTHESSKSEFAESEELGTTLNDAVPVQLPEGRVNNLQMHIDWNPENCPDTQPAVPTLGRLPPINGKKGPGNQSSMANLKTSSSNSSSNNNSSRSLPTGTIRGTLPEELREFCKGSSVGSLIMGPDGEIICLSLLGSVQDTDIPVQLDFITDEACLSLVSEVSQEEEWPGIQQSQLQDLLA